MIDEMSDGLYDNSKHLSLWSLIMWNKKSLFETNNQIINYVVEIAELVGKL